MDLHKGLAIGGPHDEEEISAKGEYFNCVKEPEMSFKLEEYADETYPPRIPFRVQGQYLWNHQLEVWEWGGWSDDSDSDDLDEEEEVNPDFDLLGEMVREMGRTIETNLKLRLLNTTGLMNQFNKQFNRKPEEGSNE